MPSDVLVSSPSGYEEDFGLPKILVIGCGGAGNNAVSRLARYGLPGARTLAINTDNQQLQCAWADAKILIGQRLTRGIDRKSTRLNSSHRT